MTDRKELIERLRYRAEVAREEGTATAIGDAIHFEEAADAIEAEQCAVVKPLVWEGYWASSPYGPYSIWEGFENEGGRWCVSWSSTVIGHAHSFDTAKAAAEADYETRILSALTILPAAEVAAKATALAIEAARNTAICCKSDFSTPTVRIDIANAIDDLHTDATRAALQKLDAKQKQ